MHPPAPRRTDRRTSIPWTCLLAALLAGAIEGPTPAAAAEDTPGPVIISEFLAANDRGLADERGRHEDWIEVHNVSTGTVDLAGWTLRNRPKATGAWTFPATNLPPGGHLLVWASGRDQHTAGRPLHARFRLSAEGEYLALGRPDGTLSTVFAPKYPPQWPDVSFGWVPGSTQATRFPRPTPGRPNLDAGTSVGPHIETVSHEEGGREAGSPLRIRARVAPVLGPTTNVTLVWRVLFGPEQQREMTPEEGGVWAVALPAREFAAGSMLRWRVTASDAAGGRSSYPPEVPEGRISRYLGTVLQPERVRSRLPVFHLFVAPGDVDSMDSDPGTQGCLFYDGEFYDAVRIKIRGNSTAGFPKRSHRLEFPADHRFRHPGPGGRVRATSLMAEWGDPTYLRQHLSFWLQAQTGSAAPFHEPVRVELNGSFWQLAMHSEVLGEDLLARHGLDPRGALYKAVGTVDPWENSTGGFEKKTRRHEDHRDYTSLARALAPQVGLEGRRRALFDRFHLPSVINYLAVARLTQEDDDIWANMSLYHDNEGTGEWRPIPFDMNVSWGYSFAAPGIHADRDSHRSHPFFGAARTGNLQGINQLYDAVIQVPETRAMFLRRLRTVMDRWLQPPGTPPAQRHIERHIEELAERMAPEATLDRERWGNCWYTPQGTEPSESFQLGIGALTRRFIEPRRRHLFVTHCVSNAGLLRRVGLTASDLAGIPLPQPERPPIRILPRRADPGTAEPAPVVLTNAGPDAIDLSGWKLEGPVAFNFAPGTVIPPQGTIHVVPDVRAARSRAGRATSGSGSASRFVVGPAKPGPRGAATDAPLVLRDDAGRVSSR